MLTKPRLAVAIAIVALAGALVPANLKAAPAAPVAADSASSQPALPTASAAPFLFGCEWPFQPAKALKDRFYEAGFNMARINGGGYGWSISGHQADVSDLENHGCKAILQLASHYPSADYFKFKDSYFIAQNGDTGRANFGGDWAVDYPGGAWPQYSYAGADVKAQMETEFGKYLSALRGHSNIDSIIVHNEPGYFWEQVELYDYNPQAIAAFRLWLPSQYPNIAALNELWQTKFAGFGTVDPPKDLPPVSNISSWLDWRRFHIGLIEDYLRWDEGIAKSQFPAVPVTTNIGGPIDHWFPFRLGDNYRYTEPMDLAGIDIYPGETWCDPFYGPFAIDQTNGATRRYAPKSAEASSFTPAKSATGDRPPYVLETDVYSTVKYPSLSDEQRAQMLRSEVWTFIDHGAKAVCLWSLGNAGQFNLTDGEWNARLAACRDISYQAKMLNLGAYHRPKPQVAVCMDQDTLLYYGGLETRSGTDSATVPKDALGLYGAVVSGGWAADVISTTQLKDGATSVYPVIVLSMQTMMDDSLAGALTTFVKNGGVLIADAPFALVDRHGLPLAEHESGFLSNVFGIKSLTASRGTLSSDMTAASDPIAGAFCREDIKVGKASIEGAFSDGSPAITIHHFGKGGAVFIGSGVGVAFDDNRTNGNANGLKTYLASLISRRLSSPSYAVSGAGDAYVDSGALEDDNGNMLIGLTVPSNDGAAISPVSGLSIVLPSFEDRQGFVPLAFPPSKTENGVVTSGPVKVVSTSTSAADLRAVKPAKKGDAQSVLAIPSISIDSATPILFAHDAPPMLALSTAPTIAAGADIIITVTVYNPSPRAVTGTVSLILPTGWKQADPDSRISIAPYDSQSVTMKSNSLTATGRMTVSAQFTPVQAAQPVLAIPVDVTAKTPV